jgi:hypothetical protein
VLTIARTRASVHPRRLVLWWRTFESNRFDVQWPRLIIGEAGRRIEGVDANPSRSAKLHGERRTELAARSYSSAFFHFWRGWLLQHLAGLPCGLKSVNEPRCLWNRSSRLLGSSVDPDAGLVYLSRQLWQGNASFLQTGHDIDRRR